MSADYVGAPDLAGEFILRDVTVVDVTDGSRTAHQDIRVIDGTIAGIGPTGQGAPGVAVVEGNGAFVVPGYVDSHAHALNDPGQVAGAYALMFYAQPPVLAVDEEASLGAVCAGRDLYLVTRAADIPGLEQIAAERGRYTLELGSLNGVSLLHVNGPGC